MALRKSDLIAQVCGEVNVAPGQRIAGEDGERDHRLPTGVGRGEGPKQMFAYVIPYTRRVAISNDRRIGIGDGKVRTGGKVTATASGGRQWR